MSTPRQCFYIPVDALTEHGYVPSLVTESEPGHTPLSGNGAGSAPWYWGGDYDAARRVCIEQNARLGIDEAAAAAIVASSMAAGR